MSTPVNIAAFQSLKWPDDKEYIAQLNLDQKQVWYASQDSRSMIFVGDSKEFQRFWYWCYLFPLRIKRLIYRLKWW